MKKIFVATIASLIFSAHAQTTPPTPPQGLAYPPPNVSDRAILPKEALEVTQEARTQREQVGYVDRGAALTRAQFTLERVQQRRLQVEAGAVRREEQGFFRLEDLDPSKLNIRPVPTLGVHAGSENFIIPAGNSVRRLFTRTEFGPLYVQEQPGSLQFAVPSNLSIGGHEATLVVSKHTQGWATTVVTTNGRKTYYIEAGRRLSEKERTKFVEWIRQLIEQG